MLRRELLNARRALRSVSEGASGPRSKKQRGEWESAFHSGRGSCARQNRQRKTGVVGSFNGFKSRTRFSGTAVMELERGGGVGVRAATPLLSRIQFVFSESALMRILFTAGASSVSFFFLWCR